MEGGDPVEGCAVKEAMDLPGNEAAASRIRQAADRGTLSHALLLTGRGDQEAAARFAAAAMECTAQTGRPCGVCSGCRKVQEGIHPDVIFVRDSAHKNLAMDVVRAARADAWIRPNEGTRKVYWFEDCARLTEADQNVLLKVVEEGPPYAAFLFCAENPAAMLPTLRSRCVEIKLRPQQESHALEEHAAALCRAICGKERLTIAEFFVSLERRKPERTECADLIEQTRTLFAAALFLKYGQEIPQEQAETAAYAAKNLTKVQIMRTIEILQKYSRDCSYNVNVGQVLGALAVELEGTL